MRRYFLFGLTGAVLLALFLWLRPIACGAGIPAAPDTAGRAAKLLPEETAAPAAGPAPTAAATSSVAAHAPGPAAAGPPLEAVEQQIVALTNEERRRAGLAPLTVEPFLVAAARKQSTDMLARDFFDHVNPDGLTPQDRVEMESRSMIGSTRENIARESPPKNDAQGLVSGWMNSPGHRENILSPEITHIGVGVVTAGRELRATQVFARIVALTDPTIPPTVRRGDAIHVAVRPAAASTQCGRLDVFSGESGLIVLGPMPTGDVKMSVPSGVYKLRFYCGAPGAARGVIFSGPPVEVKE